jgi:hypothetical protein
VVVSFDDAGRALDARFFVPGGGPLDRLRRLLGL